MLQARLSVVKAQLMCYSEGMTLGSCQEKGRS